MLNTSFVAFASLYLLSATAHGLLSRTFNKGALVSAPKRAFLSFLFGTLPIAALVSIFSDFTVSDVRQTVINLTLAGFGAAAFHILTMKSLKHMPASRWQIINGSYVIFSALIAAAFLGEALSVHALLAVLLIVAGIGVISYRKATTDADERKYGIMVLVAALGVAAALVFQSNATHYASNGTILLSMAVIQTVLLGITTLAHDKKHALSVDRAHGLRFGLLGALNGVLSLFYLLAQNNTSSVSLLTTTTSLSIPLSAIAAIFILQEKSQIPQKIIGSLLVFSGVVLYGLA